jgi:hypothetical protein
MCFVSRTALALMLLLKKYKIHVSYFPTQMPEAIWN